MSDIATFPGTSFQYQAKGAWYFGEYKGWRLTLHKGINKYDCEGFLLIASKDGRKPRLLATFFHFLTRAPRVNKRVRDNLELWRRIYDVRLYVPWTEVNYPRRWWEFYEQENNE